MHTYRSRVPEGQLADPPPVNSTPFRDALDVVRRAEIDPVIGWATYPDVWHLDETGTFQCYLQGLESVFHPWVAPPRPLHSDPLC